MIAIIFPYRNREPRRVKRSLDSLAAQTNKQFEVFFVDYGSNSEAASQIRPLVSSYPFASYTYSYTEFQPWSRSKAINIGLKKVAAEYVFTADIDIIFSPDFIEKLHEIKEPSQAYYFKVGFLNEREARSDKKFSEYLIQFASSVGAQGLSLFPKEAVDRVNGFDEFLHFWGAEDIDIHDRIKKAGFKSSFYSQEILLLHQWHKTYRISETSTLTRELQLSNIVRLNQYHIAQNGKNGCIKANALSWGSEMPVSDFHQLNTYPVELVLVNKIEVITHFLYCELPKAENKITSVRIVEDAFRKTLKYKVKKLLGKKVPQYYTLKEINDLLLLHIVSFYHEKPYCYSISADLKSIAFKIKK
ncbi:MAG TPA: glycosyltransferase [Flavobacterium sp.]|nr:glycosyltransferase [Flavobacterium sp.]